MIQAKIFILPSYIEGFPKVISESLARLSQLLFLKILNMLLMEEKVFLFAKEMR